MFNKRISILVALLIAMTAFSTPSAHDYLIWDPCGQPSASAFNQVLVGEGYTGVYTDDISEYLDNLSAFKPLIFFPECYQHPDVNEMLIGIQEQIDDYMNSGGAIYWEGANAALPIDYYRDELFMFDMTTCVNEPYSMLYGESENFETLQIATETMNTGEVVGGDDCVFSAPVSCPNMAIVRENPFHAILTSYNFSKLRDNGPNTRADYVNAIMNWLGVAVDIPESNSPLPEKISSIEAYPNPFNAQTRINFDIPEAANIQVRIYNILGQPVETIFNEYVSAGSHSVTWNAADYATGVYFARLESERYTGCMKVILLK